MIRVSLSPLAEQDLEEIGDYIAADSPHRAITFIKELRRTCEKLALAPAIGTHRPELGDGIRMFPHGNYLIFYRATTARMRIERIMHGARDIDRDDLGFPSQ